MKWILRILLGLVGLLVLAVVVLFVSGKRPGCGKGGDVTIDIARPPDVVWPVGDRRGETRPLGRLADEDRARPGDPRQGVGHRETWVMKRSATRSEPMRLVADGHAERTRRARRPRGIRV